MGVAEGKLKISCRKLVRREHIRTPGSAMFSEAIERNLVNGVNPWHVRIPKGLHPAQ
jgi:hypothetical protein